MTKPKTPSFFYETNLKQIMPARHGLRAAYASDDEVGFFTVEVEAWGLLEIREYQTLDGEEAARFEEVVPLIESDGGYYGALDNARGSENYLGLFGPAESVEDIRKALVCWRRGHHEEPA